MCSTYGTVEHEEKAETVDSGCYVGGVSKRNAPNVAPLRIRTTRTAPRATEQGRKRLNRVQQESSREERLPNGNMSRLYGWLKQAAQIRSDRDFNEPLVSGCVLSTSALLGLLLRVDATFVLFLASMGLRFVFQAVSGSLPERFVRLSAVFRAASFMSLFMAVTLLVVLFVDDFR